MHSAFCFDMPSMFQHLWKLYTTSLTLTIVNSLNSCSSYFVDIMTYIFYVNKLFQYWFHQLLLKYASSVLKKSGCKPEYNFRFGIFNSFIKLREFVKWNLIARDWFAEKITAESFGIIWSLLNICADCLLVVSSYLCLTCLLVLLCLFIGFLKYFCKWFANAGKLQLHNSCQSCSSFFLLHLLGDEQVPFSHRGCDQSWNQMVEVYRSNVSSAITWFFERIVIEIFSRPHYSL